MHQQSPDAFDRRILHVLVQTSALEPPTNKRLDHLSDGLLHAKGRCDDRRRPSPKAQATLQKASVDRRQLLHKASACVPHQRLPRFARSSRQGMQGKDMLPGIIEQSLQGRIRTHAALNKMLNFSLFFFVFFGVCFLLRFTVPPSPP